MNDLVARLVAAEKAAVRSKVRADALKAQATAAWAESNRAREYAVELWDELRETVIVEAGG